MNTRGGEGKEFIFNGQDWKGKDLNHLKMKLNEMSIYTSLINSKDIQKWRIYSNTF